VRAPSLGVAPRRLAVLRAVLLAALALLGLRALRLSFDERSLSRAESQQGTWLRLSAERGTIEDRDGAELAISVSAPSVYARPREVKNPEATASALARALRVDRRQLLARLRRDSNFVFLARWVAPETAARVRQLGLAGVDVTDEPRRVYPHRELAASVLGFPNIDGEGVRGIEQQEDAWLRGTPQVYRVERDARGALLGLEGLNRAAAAGGDVRLTLDARFQADAEAALADALESSGARGGMVLSLDPHTGEILALAERPGFDPNRFRQLEFPDTRSRAFQDALEPGSTIKAFLVAGALEAGAVRPGDAFDCSEPLRVPGKTIRDVHPHGVLRTGDVLRVSSNIGAVQIAHALGARRHWETLRAFGFGAPTGSGFPFESPGLLRSWRQWRPVDHATVAFGQGMSVTPVQLASAAAVLANGGWLLEPRLVAARRRSGGPWQPTAPERVRRVLSPDTAAQVVSMLEGVATPEGTARRAGLRDVRVAGKTGTAQLLDVANGTYSANRYHAWFLGIVPADEPRLVILIELDEPRRGQHQGGQSAAPLFAAVASAQLARLGIATEPLVPGARPATAVAAAPPSRAASAAAQERVHSDGQRVFLPDFRGRTLAEVKAMTAGGPLEVEFVGSGRAVDQEPDPGTILAGARKRIRIQFAADAAGGEG
jgi:cell division protein FtsI (penicillin-binding protein 3)